MVSTETVPGRNSPEGPAVAEWRVDELMRPATTTVEPTAHLAGAAYLMKHRGDSSLVVTMDDVDRRPIAIITDADISQAVADRRELESTRISDLGLAPPVTVEPGTSAREAIRLMLSRRINHLPVVQDGRLVGLVELSDLCRPLLDEEPRPGRPGAVVAEPSFREARR
jgi:CBS domain-containing protein